MPRVIKHAQVEQDLTDIWLYSRQEWGEAQADSYLDELDSCFQLLAESPLIAPERREFRVPVRIHPHASHLVIYQTTDEGIAVVRVLHKRMDLHSRL